MQKLNKITDSTDRLLQTRPTNQYKIYYGVFKCVKSRQIFFIEVNRVAKKTYYRNH